MLVEPTLRDGAAVRIRHGACTGIELPQASAVEGGDPIVDAIPFPRSAVMLDQRRDLALRLFPGHEPRGATARPRERPQQGDWLVESWQAAGAVNIEPGQQPEQPVDG